jgi:hypothetical protein
LSRLVSCPCAARARVRIYFRSLTAYSPETSYCPLEASCLQNFLPTITPVQLGHSTHIEHVTNFNHPFFTLAFQASGIDDLVGLLRSRIKPMHRSSEGPFLFAVDHCFPIRGQGTVLTGTVLRGHVAVNQTIELPELKVQASYLPS